ncbi:M20/M25/M40 family metallo-hydrolase [bacterium]|nr:M20/M25/M40 family metallo-hydrolase [bacterium]
MEDSPRRFLEALAAQAAPSGFEAPAVKCWLDYLKPHAGETFTDSYGNGFAVLNPGGDPAALITGHADEIGLMVTYIDDEGFLWVGSLGGYDAKILPAMRVKVLAKEGDLPGVVGAVPPHLQRPESGGVEVKRYKFGENIYIDIGAKDKAEADKHVRVGDPVILDYGMTELGGDLVVGRGLDNRIGIWAAAEVVRRLAGRKDQLAAKVVAMASVQEEIGGHGASMGSFRVEPDVAIAIDVTQSVDHPAAEKKRFGEVRLGKGPALAHGSANHPVVVKRLESVARRLRISLQHEALPNRTGTDADSIFSAKAGIPTAVVGLPQRYMHSPSEMVSLADLEQVARLVTEFCLDLKAGERFTVRI